MKSSDIKNKINRVWLHGTDEQKEELAEVLVSLAIESGWTNLKLPSEGFSIQSCSALAEKIHLNASEPLISSLHSFVDSVLDEITTARERDITLI